MRPNTSRILICSARHYWEHKSTTVSWHEPISCRRNHLVSCYGFVAIERQLTPWRRTDGRTSAIAIGEIFREKKLYARVELLETWIDQTVWIETNTKAYTSQSNDLGRCFARRHTTMTPERGQRDAQRWSKQSTWPIRTTTSSVDATPTSQRARELKPIHVTKQWFRPLFSAPTSNDGARARSTRRAAVVETVD